MSVMESLTDAESALAAYCSWLKRHRKPGTRKTYEPRLAAFVNWVGDRSWNEVSAKEIDQYLRGWWDAYEARYGKRPSQNTYRNVIGTLASFYEYLESQDYVMRNPMARVERVKGHRPKNDWLREWEDNAMLAAVRSPQERIVVALFRWTGVRVAEAQSLRYRDFDLRPTPASAHGSLIVPRSKSDEGEGRIIPVYPEMFAELRRWQEFQALRGLDHPNAPILATQRGTPMIEMQVWTTVKRVAVRADLRLCEGKQGTEIHPHTLRRTLGSWLINSGVRLEVVSAILGHASIETTRKYYAELLKSTIVFEALQAVR